MVVFCLGGALQAGLITYLDAADPGTDLIVGGEFDGRLNTWQDLTGNCAPFINTPIPGYAGRAWYDDANDVVMFDRRRSPP